MAVLCGLSGAFRRQVLIRRPDALQPLRSGWGAGWLCCHSFEPEGRDQRSISPTLRIVLATALGTNLGIALQQLVFRPCPSALASR